METTNAKIFGYVRVSTKEQNLNRQIDSLKKYVLDKRMLKARELLQTSEDPIYVVALKVGYPSASYFSKQFRNYFGQEPNDFRKKPE